MVKKSVLQSQRIIDVMAASNRGELIYVGVDVHTKVYAVSILSQSGLNCSFTTPRDDHGLIQQLQQKMALKVTRLVYEAGLTGFGLCRACRASGIDAIVVSANRIPRPASKTAKTDKIDSLRLAEFLSKDLLKGIYVPSEAAEARRALSRRRTDVTRSLAKAKVKIKSLLICHGLPLPCSWGEESVKILKDMAIDLLPGLRETLQSHLRDYDHFKTEKKCLTKQIQELVSPPGDILHSIPGVGPVTATTFRSEIIDPKRFDNGEQLTSYLGLAPTIQQSGESSAAARLIPTGQGTLRSLLVEAAWVLYTRAAWAKDLYSRIYMRNGKCGSKAIIAVARKLAIIMWRVWLEERPYSPSAKPVNKVPA